MISFLRSLGGITGATLCKGVNRGIGTLCAASLAFVIEFMADKSGRACRAVFIGVSVFLVGIILVCSIYC